MKKLSLTIFCLLFISGISFAEEWPWVDFTFEQLTAEKPQRYSHTLSDGTKEWFIVRFDKVLSDEEDNYAILRFLHDMGCTVKDVTKDDGKYHYSYSWTGEYPIVKGRLYVNGKFGYAVSLDTGFSVYKIERAAE